MGKGSGGLRGETTVHMHRLQSCSGAHWERVDHFKIGSPAASKSTISPVLNACVRAAAILLASIASCTSTGRAGH